MKSQVRLESDYFDRIFTKLRFKAFVDRSKRCAYRRRKLTNFHDSFSRIIFKVSPSFKIQFVFVFDNKKFSPHTGNSNNLLKKKQKKTFYSFLRSEKLITIVKLKRL